MIVKAKLIGWVRFKKKNDGAERVLLNFLGDPISQDKGDGLRVNQVVVLPEAIAPGLRAGDVEVEKSDWGNFISYVRNEK